MNSHTYPLVLASLLLVSAVSCAGFAAADQVPMLPTHVVTPTYKLMRSYNGSNLYSMSLPGSSKAGESYSTPPLLVDLHGTHWEVGYAYAALLHAETADTMQAFLSDVFPDPKDQALIEKFTDLMWDSWYSKYTPASFLAELEGMEAYHAQHNPNGASNSSCAVVSRRFFALTNMPRHEANIVAALEQEFEHGWPTWLKDAVNDIIKLLLHLKLKCDAYGVWGSRTQGGLLYSSRNVDYESDTGINRHKLAIVYHIDDPEFGGVPKGGASMSLGFSFGLGALAGLNQEGVTVSEMNVDNDVVTFSGVPFPLRLRMVLEGATDLTSAMQVWNATNNTNSFNFLIGSAADAIAVRSGSSTTGNGAYALETIMGYTAQFGANSSVERDATYDCVRHKCHKWTHKRGEVHIGKPLPEAVWRTNHGMAPRVMATQEPLFNNTVFRYDLMHTLFTQLEEADQAIDDAAAVGIVATLGTKGANYYTCEQYLDGDNIMSIAYAPGPRSSGDMSSGAGGGGHLYVAWESGSHSTWRPAACSPYVLIDLSQWF